MTDKRIEWFLQLNNSFYVTGKLELVVTKLKMDYSPSPNAVATS